MCPLPQTHKPIAQIKPIALQQVIWQATAIGQMYLSLHLYSRANICHWPTASSVFGLSCLNLNSDPSAEKTDAAERCRTYKHYITQYLSSVILPPFPNNVLTNPVFSPLPCSVCFKLI